MMYDRNYRSWHVYVANLAVALLFLMVAPVKAQGPEIRLYNNTARVPVAQGGAVRLIGMETPSFLDGIRRQSITVQHFTAVMCNEMILEFFDMTPGDTQVVTPGNGELCTMFTEDGAFYGSTPHWQAQHTTDPLAYYYAGEDQDNICYLITELWCQFY